MVDCPGPIDTTKPDSFFSFPKSGTIMLPTVVSSDSIGFTIKNSINKYISFLLCLYVVYIYFFLCFFGFVDSCFILYHR